MDQNYHISIKRFKIRRSLKPKVPTLSLIWLTYLAWRIWRQKNDIVKNNLNKLNGALARGVCYTSISLGNTNYDQCKLKPNFNHVNRHPNRSFNMMELYVKIPLKYKNHLTTRREYGVNLLLSRHTYWGQLVKRWMTREGKIFVLSPARGLKNGGNSPTLVRHRDLRFQSQRRVSGRGGMASAKDARELQS